MTDENSATEPSGKDLIHSPSISTIAELIELVRQDWETACLNHCEELAATIHPDLWPDDSNALESFRSNEHIRRGFTNLFIARQRPWFRGIDDDFPLLPKLYRPTTFHYSLHNSSFPDLAFHHSESYLIQLFRAQATTMPNAPAYGDLAEWLSLMQHSGLPTRLLDWTEGALIALYFAVRSALPNVSVDYKMESSLKRPVIWMLHPSALNLATVSSTGFPLPWDDPDLIETDSHKMLSQQAIESAFGRNNERLDYPVAISPTCVHARIAAQQGRFTFHGTKKEPLELLLPRFLKSKYLCKYYIESEAVPQLLNDLQLLGTSGSTLFPDFDGIARDLSLYY